MRESLSDLKSKETENLRSIPPADAVAVPKHDVVTREMKERYLDKDDNDDEDQSRDGAGGSLSSSSSNQRQAFGIPPNNIAKMSLNSIGEYSTTGSMATNRRSSLEMRKKPVDVLLQPTNFHETTSVLSEDCEEEDLSKRELKDNEIDCLRFLCLRPNYTLRKQMMLSFGSINLITITVVVVVCVALSLIAGQKVKSTSTYTMEHLARQSLGTRSRYLAESLTESIILIDTVKFLHEATQDRFEGHPNPTDDYVPFFDLESGTNVYPVRGPPMPLEWNVSPNVNESNHEEHLQGRWKDLERRPIDTSQAGFFMQGACNPLESDPLSDTYWPNCTEANNDITTGGVVRPSDETGLYHRKGSDMVPILRTVFEQWEMIRDVGLYFLNNGAGAGMNYPHYSVSTQSTYTSIGCDWLLSPNPYDPNRTIGSTEMARNCRPEGEEVSSRLYNPMERSWYRDMASNPEKLYMDAVENAWNPGEWLLVLGRSVYDRVTKEFVACIYIGIDLGIFGELLKNSSTSQRAEATVVYFDQEGYVVASSKDLTSDGRLAVYNADLGLSKESYNDLLVLVDFESEWDPKEARQAFESFSTSDTNFYVSVHPMPPVPDEYNPVYRPVFFVVTSLHLQDLYDSFEALNDNVDERVNNIIAFTWICGLVGLAVAALMIFAMAHMLTSPLTNMNKIANEIVGSFGDSKKEDDIRRTGDVYLERKCTPRTELTDVVAEFNKMVTTFSGVSEAKSEKFKDDDMENNFPARRDLYGLYQSRYDQLFRYNITGETRANYERNEADDDSSSTGIVAQPSIAYLHFGPTYTMSQTTLTRRLPGNVESRTKCTALFLWIVILIATPLLFITILVSAGVITTINLEFARSTEDIQAEYLSLQKQVLLSYARLRAGFVSSYTQKFANDLYLLTRFSSWLISGGLNKSDSFTEMSSGIEDCKEYANNFSQCPYVQENFVCDCAWKEIGYEDECSIFPNASMSRRLQKLHWISEFSTSADGDRLTTTFPVDHFSPQSGQWWDNLTTVPGFEQVSNWSGHDTTYERIRSFAAVPVAEPLFNYQVGEGEQTTLGLGIGFEEDGTFISYEGCFSSFHVTLSSWSSTTENRAAIFRPELCPVGKYGYDPRCRGWYNSGRERYIAGKSILHITPPYLFAAPTAHGPRYAQTATISIFDASTSDHLGQTYLDFLATPIYRALKDNIYLGTEGFSILITVELGNTPETIIGPGMAEGEDSVYIGDGVLPYDLNCSTSDQCEERRNEFEIIVNSMKKGESNEVAFVRRKSNSELETLHLAYAPVYVTSTEPVDSSDYSRGVHRVRELVYSLGLVETETEMLLPFREIERATKEQTTVAIGVLTAIIFLATLTIVHVSYRLAKSFSEPMIYLLRLLQSINEDAVGHDPPPVQEIKASHEIAAFSRTLEALFRIIRSANIAFFNGELDFAYRVLNDALRLFRRLDNKKAIGIASNNVGNTLLGIYREMTVAKLQRLYGLTKEDIVSLGIAHFHNAIQLGEKAYDEFYELQGWSPSCLDFMQHLSNRYFNRGLFLLHVKQDHKNPKEIEHLGRRDIQIARDMDHEVVTYGEEIGWGTSDRAEKRFNVNIVRIRGFNILYELGYNNDWEVEELIEETMNIVREECKNPQTDFFSNMSLAGRLQELDIQLMRYHSNHGDLETAAKVAVRMLIEDENIFTEAMRQALGVLIKFAENGNADSSFRRKLVPVLRSYRKTVMEVINERRQSAMDDVDSMSASLTKGSVRNRKRCRLSDHAGDESSRFVTMEDF